MTRSIPHVHNHVRGRVNCVTTTEATSVLIVRPVVVLQGLSMEGFEFAEVLPNLRHGPRVTVLEHDRFAVLSIEMVIMEWKLSREVVVIHAQGQSLEEHIVFHGFLVALVGLKLVAVRHLTEVLQMRLHLHGTSCRDHVTFHILTAVAPFRRLALLLDSLAGGMRDQAALSVGFFFVCSCWRAMLFRDFCFLSVPTLSCWVDDVDIGVVGAKSAEATPATMGRVASEGRRSVPLGEVA